MSALVLTWQIALSLCVLMLSIYSIYQGYLAIVSSRIKSKEENTSLSQFPTVVLQLPLFNEGNTIDATFKSILELTYPKEQLQIQVLDDSTDEESRRIARSWVEGLKKKGFKAEYLWRADRIEYKAGALREGLEKTESEFIAILDADFRSSSNWLEKGIGPFKNPEVGIVQFRWSYFNLSESWFTQMQALPLEVHFRNEHNARYNHRYLSNFNGTAGILRRSAIENSGGWSGDTLTEDIDLSYRMQLIKYRLVYIDINSLDSELPHTASAYRTQQRRWNKGGAETLKKLFLSILKSDLNFSQKLFALFHLSGSSFYLASLGLFILSLFGLPLKGTGFLDESTLFWTFIQVALSINTLVLYICFYKAHSRSTFGFNILRFTRLFITYILYTTGLGWHHGKAVLEGLIGIRSPFERTPKKGSTTSKKHRPPYIELLISILFFAAVLVDLRVEFWPILGIHLVGGIGYLLSFSHACKA
jgi:cellulose synthase/poly-beta-1,6-N-acetylglucosamine synthase-like glycosyltransferase